MAKYSFVTVSNRLPISVAKQDGALVYTRSSGGLATALSSVERTDAVWVGWCGLPTEELTTAEQRQVREEFAKHACVPVFLARQQVARYYDGYSNDTLWPLFHYFQSIARFDDAYWQAYKEVNELFASVAQKHARSDAHIWVHDYQLMLVPELLRAGLPRSVIGFFLHIPFPSFEIFRLLPERSAILHGLLGADVIGFHTYDYTRYFLGSCARLLDLSDSGGTVRWQGRAIKIGVYPISIDYAKFAKAPAQTAVKKDLHRLRQAYKGHKLILSIDRLDYSKGVMERLEAFRQLLHRHPSYREQVQLIMVAVPSRTDVDSYQQLRARVEQAIGRINGTYGTIDWTPISYQFKNRPFTEICALYHLADVMVVTPVRDGMNLVAKEFVAAKQTRPGVLVLSEMAGAIDELPEALPVKPNSAAAIAEALHTALEMPRKEQLRRLHAMQQRIKTYDVRYWVKRFVDDMATAAKSRTRPEDALLTTEQTAALQTDFVAATRRLIILDYDGTIKPFQPSHATLAGLPSLQLWRTIRQLSTRPDTTVAIVSGRPKKALQLWFSGLSVSLAAEHGAWTRLGRGWQRAEVDFREAKRLAADIMQNYVVSTPGSSLERKDFSLVWHYRRVPHDVAYDRARKLKYELSQQLADFSVDVHYGNKIIEVAPRNVNKGHVVRELLRLHRPDFVLCAGDDYSDEGMFQALDSTAYSIKVGSGETHASYRVTSVDDMIALLEELAAH